MNNISLLEMQPIICVFMCFLSVNNAGVGMLGPLESISIEEMKQVFETNFFGVVRMIKEVMPDMKKRRSGHIVVMSSVMGLQGMPCLYLAKHYKINNPVNFELRRGDLYCLCYYFILFTIIQ